MTKPVYVSVEFWRETRDNPITIEGWLTVDDQHDDVFLITPSLDFDEDVIKIAIPKNKLVSLKPLPDMSLKILSAADIQGVAGTWEEAARQHFHTAAIGDRNTVIVQHGDGTFEEVDLNEPAGETNG